MSVFIISFFLTGRRILFPANFTYFLWPQKKHHFEKIFSLTTFFFQSFQHFSLVEKDLDRFGERISSEIHDLGFQCENEKPYVQTFDAWGKRIDKLVTCSAWKRMHDIAAEEGLIALGYDDCNEEWR